MIIEIKKKRTKFGSVLSFVNNDEQLTNLLKHNQSSAYVIAHRIGASDDRGYGILIVGHRSVPKFKNVIGHYISQIRGGELAVFLRPDSSILGDASGIFNHLDANRIERAYGLYLGPAGSPAAIVISSTLMEHLFHAIPDSLGMDGDWVGFIDGWLKKSLFGGRYFDGNALASVSTKEVKPADEYIIDDYVPEPDPVASDSGPAVEAPVFEEPEVVVKKKPGRPKTKK